MPYYDLSVHLTYETEEEAETAQIYIQNLLEYPGSSPTFFKPIAWGTGVEVAKGFDNEPLEPLEGETVPVAGRASPECYPGYCRNQPACPPGICKLDEHGHPR